MDWEKSSAFNLTRPGSPSLNYSSSSNSENLEDFKLVYLDQNIHNRDLHLGTLENLELIISCVKISDNFDECLSYIQAAKSEEIIFIVSGTFGEIVVRNLHELPQLAWIYVFCLNLPKNEEWAKRYSKIRGIYDNRSSLLKTLRQDVKQHYINLSSISTFSAMDVSTGTSVEELKRSNGDFIFYQLLPEMMLRTPNTKDAKNDLVNLARACYKGNKTQLEKIRNFEENYRSAEAINWYTKDIFLYRIINKAIRVANFDLIWKCRFFIADLHEQLQKKQFSEDRENLISVYRGQIISKDDLDFIIKHTGSYIMFKTFLSTSANRKVAEDFAGNGEQQPSKESVIFEIEIQSKYSANPLTNIEALSENPYEEETLLSMGNAFRIESCKPADNSKRWTVKLTLEQHILDSPMVFLRKHMGEPTTLLQLEKFILEPGSDFINGDPIRVKQLIADLDLKSFDIACFYVSIGHFQSDYEQKLRFYRNAIDSLREGHSLIPLMLNSVAAIYYCQSMHSVALECYEKAHANNKELFLSNDKLMRMIENLKKPSNEFLEFKNYELYSKALNHLLSGKEIAIGSKNYAFDHWKGNFIGPFWKFFLGLELEKKLTAYHQPENSSSKVQLRESILELYDKIISFYAQENNYTTAIANCERVINFMNLSIQSAHPTTTTAAAATLSSSQISLEHEKELHTWYNTLTPTAKCLDNSQYYGIENEINKDAEKLCHAIDNNDISIFERIKKGDLEKLCNVRLLFESDWSAPEKELQTPFQRACLLGRLDFVQRMLEVGIPANQSFDVTSYSTTRGAFMFACQSQNVPVIRLLIEKGANKNSWGSCSQAYAAHTLKIHGHHKLKGDIFYHDFPGWVNVYAIHLAIIFNNKEMFDELYVSKDSPCLLTKLYHSRHPLTQLHYSTLHLACLFKQPIEVIEMLLKDGANAELRASREHRDNIWEINSYYADELTDDKKIENLLLFKRYEAMKSKFTDTRNRTEEDAEKLRDGKLFQIFVKTLSGGTITITTQDSEQIESIKVKIEDTLGIPRDEQILYWRGKQVENNRTIHECGISKDKTLHLMMRLLGGQRDCNRIFMANRKETSRSLNQSKTD